jgi:replicative DNA helicase
MITELLSLDKQINIINNRLASYNLPVVITSLEFDRLKSELAILTAKKEIILNKMSLVGLLVYGLWYGGRV